jgi:serine/threonine-protein kinase HipA
VSSYPDILDDEHLLQLLQRLPMRHMIAGEGGLRLSLAGAQSKGIGHDAEGPGSIS